VVSHTLVARSISRAVKAGPLAEGEQAWCVPAVFDRACDLLTPGGEVIALVLPEVGPGPLNIVLEAPELPDVFRRLEPGMAASLVGSRLCVGELEVNLGQAEIWEPCPDWRRLQARRVAIVDCLPLVQAVALRHAPESSLLSLLPPDEGSHSSGAMEALLAVARQAVTGLHLGWAGDDDQLRVAAAHLAGLGAGLTPAGDDLLSGAMLWAWLAHPEPASFCLHVLETAAPVTTTLSAAFLRAAARGECSAAWHRLLAGLDDGAGDRVSAAVQDILSFGHTSGADALAGFLLMARREAQN
jgi:hypothetical protein